ncbi:MAG: VC0807 family protein [Pseudomonadota bacterium]
MHANPATPPERDRPLLDLGLNIIAPTLVLTQLSGDQALGTTWALLAALAFPLGYGAWDFRRRRRYNLFSTLGLVSVLLTGGISLLELPPRYLAVKEAAIPGLLGIAVLASLKTRWPLVRNLLFNDAVLNTRRIESALAARGTTAGFERAIDRATWLLAASFFLSSLLNYVLASTLVTAAAGSVEYNQQLGRLTALSYPLIALPATAVMAGVLFYLFRRLTRLTGLAFEDIVRGSSPDPEAARDRSCGT